MNYKLENKLSEEISLLFGNRIVCLLYYGSNAFNKDINSDYSDYDFCLVLDKYDSKDLINLKKIISKYNRIDITLHSLFDLELIGWSNFQHGNHGEFFLLHLANSKIILGNNIFQRKLSIIDYSNIKKSIKTQIIEYFWRLDHWYFTVKNENELNIKFKKYLIRILQDILLYKGDISFFEINTINSQEFIDNWIDDKNYISIETKKSLMKINQNSYKVEYYVYLKTLIYNDFRNTILLE